MQKISIDDLFYDMTITNGQITRAFNSEAIAQNVRERLLTIQQEWFMDLDQGLPWFSDLLGHNIDKDKIKGYILLSIAKTPGVETVETISLYNADATRKMGIEYSYTDIYGKFLKESI